MTASPPPYGTPPNGASPHGGQQPGGGPSGWPPPGGFSPAPSPPSRNRTGLIVALALVAATVVVCMTGAGLFVLSQRRATTASGPAENQPVRVEGSGLVAMPTDRPAGADPAVGQPAPKVTGASFNGSPVTIEAPAVVMFAAHWCPHCQREVPALAPIAREYRGPVKLYLVSSSARPGQTNYPPSAWLRNEQWPTPVLADDAGSGALGAFGIGAFPGFVAVAADGTVRQRTTGEIGAAGYRALIDQAAR